MALKRIVAGLVGVVALVALAGCSGSPGGGVAAVVDGQVITETSVDRAALAMRDIVSSSSQYDGMDFTGFMLTNLIDEQLFANVLASMGQTITDDMRDQYWQANFDPTGAEYNLWTDSRTRAAMVGYIDVQLINAMLTNQTLDYNGLLAAAQAVPVKLNPRYGTWDSANLAVSSREDNLTAGALAAPTVFTMPA